MPLSEDERRQRANQYIQRYYPDATVKEAERITETVVLQFEENYSPDPAEQTSPTASGTGATFEQYVIYTGRTCTELEPIGVTQRDLSQIIIRCLM